MISIKVLNHRVLKGISSASGIIKIHDKYLIIGDDSPYIFSLSDKFDVISKFPIDFQNNLKVGRIEKAIKKDFEAMELIGEQEIIIFGSGSKSPERDICNKISIKDFHILKTYNISEFYDKLRKLDILQDSYLNIEAVAYRDGNLFLFNRGQNCIFTFNYQELMEYFENLIPLPSFKINSYKLPEIGGIESGFSGATTLANHPFIIFTSSVEDTPNAYDDGEILGSFVGMIEIVEDGLSTTFKSVKFPSIQKTLKIESVTIKEEIKYGTTKIVVVTDDDIEESLILECELTW